jgi:hypothetical protein
MQYTNPYRAIALFFSCILSASLVGQTPVLNVPGPFSFTNTDMVVSNTYSANVQNCSSISFSVDFAFSLPWAGSGNMEAADECPVGGPTCPGNPANPSGTGCPTCWDFLWVRYLVNGSVVGSDLLGVTQATLQSGTLTFGPVCTFNAANASMIIELQNWASDETTTFSNVQIICWGDQATLSAAPTSACQGANFDLNGTLTTPGTIASTMWTGPGTIDNPSQLSTTASSTALGPNVYTLTTTDDNGCTGTTTTSVTITPGPSINPPNDVTVCNTYSLPAITGTNIPAGAAYYTGPNGTGTQYLPGQAITSSASLFAYVGIGVCSDQEPVDITILPAPNVVDLPNQVACGSFTLPAINGTNLTGNEAYYSAPNGGGTQYNPGDALTNSGTYYIYDGMAPCSDQESFTLTVTATPNLNSVFPAFACGQYALPIISGTNLPPATAYWTGPNGTGTQYTAGQTINTSTTLYIYANGGAGCTDETTLNITVDPPPTVNDIPNVAQCGGYTLPPITGINLTGAQAYYSGPNGTGTVYAEGATITGSGTYYIYDSAGPGCSDQESFTLTLTPGPVITNPADVSNCGAYTLPNITGTNIPANAAYFTNTNGTGTQYTPGQSINANTTLYLYASTGPGCTAQQDVAIAITTPPTLVDPANITACGTTTLPSIAGTNLSGNQAYYTAPNGGGTQLAAGATVSTSGTYYVFDQSAPGCTDQESFTVTITPGPAITNPMDVSNCGAYTLPAITGTNVPTTAAYFTQPNGAGTSYTAGQAINVSATLYLYANAGAGCTSQQDIAITIAQPPVITPPANITACGTFTLPALTGTNLSGAAAYFSVPAGAGTPLVAGATISASGTYYAFDQSAPGCSDEASFTVTITPGPAITNPADVSNCGAYTLPAITGTNVPTTAAYFTQPNGAGTSYAAGQTINASTTLYLYANAGAGCTSQQDVAITIAQPPVITPPANITACGTFTLPALAGTNLSGTAAYFSAPAGAGTPLAAGATISASGTYYAFDQSAPGCSDEASFTVTITPGPAITNPADVSNCGTYTLPAITGTNVPTTAAYFTQPNGAGTSYAAGQTINASTTLYLYANAGAGCTSQQDVAITIAQPPVITPPANITACGTFTLPALAGTNLSGTAAYYSAPAGAGTPLPAGATISASGTYYAFDQTAPGCSDEASFTVTITPGPAITNPVDVSNCGAYTLPAITGTNVPTTAAYFTQPNGAGTSYAAGQTINASTTLYLYVNAGAGCTSQQDLQITITSPPQITAPQNITACGGVVLPAITGSNLTGNQAYYTQPNGLGSQLLAGNLVTTSGTYFAYDSSSVGCSDQESFLITVTAGPFIDSISAVSACGSYTLPPIVGSNITSDAAYYSGTMGTGTKTNPGTTITSSGNYYAYSSTPNGCFSEQLLQVQIVSGFATTYRDTLCGGQSVTIGAQVFNQANPSGVVNLITSQGCDSTITVNLSFGQNTTTPVTILTCNPNAVGSFRDTLTNVAGCDSILVVSVVFNANAVDTTNLTAFTCNPTQVGTNQQSLTNSFGCDSLVITTTVLATTDTTKLQTTTCNPLLVGTSLIVLTNVVGCDSIIQTTTTLLPTDTTLLQATSCNPAQVGVSQVRLTNAQGCDSLVITTTTFSLSDTTLLQATSCNPAQVGVSQVRLTNAQGCDSLLITTTTFSLSDTTLLQATSCNPAQVGVSQVSLTNSQGCDSLVITTTTLSATDTVRITAPTCDQFSIGLVVSQTLPGSDGCDSVTLITFIADPQGCNIQLALTQTPVTCPGKTDGFMRFTTVAQTYPLGYRVLSNNQIITTGTIQNANQTGQATMIGAGVYTLEVFAVGDTTRSNFTITTLPAPILVWATSDFNGYSSPCFGSNLGSFTLNITTIPQPFSLTWSDNGIGTTRDSLRAGTYSVFLNYSNGCLDTIEFEIDEPPALVLDYTLDIIPCSTQGGSLSDLEVTGGVGPYSTRLNQIDLAQNPNPAILPQTPYVLETTDANGCSVQDTFEINGSSSLLQAAISKDTTIFAGSGAQLSVQVSDTALLQSIQWSPGACADCFTYTVNPFEDTQYSVTLVDTNGCPLTLTTEVKVDKYEVWQIPNVLKPNSLDNEFFGVYVPDFVVSIDGWEIYDRWGDQIYKNTTVTTERYVVLWDGKSIRDNKPMNPGVYVYMLRYTLFDGSQRLTFGDVTVVR